MDRTSDFLSSSPVCHRLRGFGACYYNLVLKAHSSSHSTTRIGADHKHLNLLSRFLSLYLSPPLSVSLSRCLSVCLSLSPSLTKPDRGLEDSLAKPDRGPEDGVPKLVIGLIFCPIREDYLWKSSNF